ncbi:MAG: hypothetical protein CSA33_07490 [Desulfobulbus propionicus]|nr:MAG: hypothetical protein CSA33_07490 [Desulfobulbus propionicus]
MSNPKPTHHQAEKKPVLPVTHSCAQKRHFIVANGLDKADEPFSKLNSSQKETGLANISLSKTPFSKSFFLYNNRVCSTKG